jgi:hypothetical protein
MIGRGSSTRSVSTETNCFTPLFLAATIGPVRTRLPLTRKDDPSLLVRPAHRSSHHGFGDSPEGAGKRKSGSGRDGSEVTAKMRCCRYPQGRPIPFSFRVAAAPGIFPSPGMLFTSVRNCEMTQSLRGCALTHGEIQYATFVGGTRHSDASCYNAEATGVFANNNGDVYVTRCTVDDSLPATSGALQAQRKGTPTHWCCA